MATKQLDEKTLKGRYVICRWACNGNDSFVVLYEKAWNGFVASDSLRGGGYNETTLKDDLRNYHLISHLEINDV